MKQQFWLLHALGPIPTKEADGGDLKWLGAIVKDVDEPEKEFDCRPVGVNFAEHSDWRQVNVSNVDVFIEKTRDMSIKAKLAKAIGVDVDIHGNVTSQAKRARVVAYSLRNESNLLNRILETDGYRARITELVSPFSTTRWFVAGYLVAKPVTDAAAEQQADKSEVGGEEENDEEEDEDEGAALNQGTEQGGEDGGGLGAEVDPGALASAALGVPVTVPIEIQIQGKVRRTRRVRSDPVESHIFAVVYRGLKKELFSRGLRLRDGPTGEGAFGEGGRGQGQERPEIATAVVSLGESSVAEEVGATLESEDDYVDTHGVESEVFDNPADAALFEDMFGGGLEFAFKEKLPDE